MATPCSSPDIARRLLAAPDCAITVTIDRKDGYDDDDMKVITDGRPDCAAIGKKLPVDGVNGESIGFLRFNAAGAAIFVAELERTMRTLEGTGLWYLSAINRLAGSGVDVRTASIEGLRLGGAGFPADLEQCRAIAGSWLAPRQQRAAQAPEEGRAAAAGLRRVMLTPGPD